jgi:topoisomerase IA-like protein
MASAGKKPGLYANIHAKQERIAHGSGEKMRKPGSEGAPSADAFDKAEKTEKPAAKKAAAKKAPAKKAAAKKAPAKKAPAKKSAAS